MMVIGNNITKRRGRTISSSRGRNDGSDEEMPTVKETESGAAIPKKTQISGNVIVFDDSGWKQKVSISYDLTVRSFAAEGSDHDDRVFTFVELNWFEIAIPESTYQSREFRPPQFRIHQATINLGPSLDQVIPEEKSDDYTDSWSVGDQFPDSMTYATIAETVTAEKSAGAKIKLSPLPSGTFEAGMKWGHSSQTPHLGTALDLKHCQISMTPDAGMRWKYLISKNSDLFRTRMRLQSHRGQTSVSEKFPSSIEARVSTVLEINNSSMDSHENIGGILIGYRHISVSLHTDVMWDKERYAQFPSPHCKGGHQSRLSHQFRGGAGSWVKPMRVFANSGKLETELSLRPMANGPLT
jgi:hypothetical protein